MKYLFLEEVIEIHSCMIKKYGGLEGIRDLGLLISALEMPKARMFGEDLHSSIYDKASAYLYHIVQNHPFSDGNKRTGAASSLIFLDMNGIELDKMDVEFEELVVDVAQGKVHKKEISAFFKNSCDKIIC
jgi:death-on-curing protein